MASTAGLTEVNASFQIERGDDVVGVLDQRTIPLLAPLEGAVRHLPLGDVEHEADAPLGLAGRTVAEKDTRPFTSTHLTDPSARTMRCSSWKTPRPAGSKLAERESAHALPVLGMNEIEDVRGASPSAGRPTIAFSSGDHMCSRVSRSKL